MSIAAQDPVAPLPAVPSRAAGRRHPIVAFLVRRIAIGLVTLLAASLLIFLATNALPGNVAQVVLGKNATPARLAEYEKKLGLDKPILVQYGNWLSGLVHGDFGQSAVGLASGESKAPISALIGTPLRNSMVLGLIATLLLVPLSLIFGTIAAVRARSRVDDAISYSALFLGSLPEFVLGTFLILVFFTQLNLLPPVALVAPGASPLDHPDALVLPVLTLLGVSLAFCVRQVRIGVLESLGQDYVASARLNGLRERRVVWGYAVRNALAPSVQSFAQTIQYLFGGIIIVEALYDYPGIGRLLVQAVQAQDVTEVAAIAIILAALYIAINIVADLIVVLLVPKLRTSV
jgi:peptide/nickel transport system permease protein